MKIKEYVKKTAKQYGYQIKKFRSNTNPLVGLNFDLVFDVGANRGTYGSEARADGYANKIVSFEPLSGAHAALTMVARSDPLWTIHDRCAVGSAPGETEINIAGNSFSSSILSMLPTLSDAAPETKYIGKETVEVITLDSVFHDYAEPGERVFLKIDTQGYEKYVLDGAVDCLEYIDGFQLELSIVPLYESQQIYPYFLRRFAPPAFQLWSVIPGFSDPNSGQMLEFDAVFIRSTSQTRLKSA